MWDAFLNARDGAIGGVTWHDTLSAQHWPARWRLVHWQGQRESTVSVGYATILNRVFRGAPVCTSHARRTRLRLKHVPCPSVPSSTNLAWLELQRCLPCAKDSTRAGSPRRVAASGKRRKSGGFSNPMSAGRKRCG